MLPVYHYKKGIINPTLKCEGHNFIGGVYCDRKYINYAHLYKKGPYLKPVIIESEEVIFGGIFFNHFGHFLLETLSRLWYIREHPHIRIAFTTLENSSSLAKWQLDILKLFGIDKNIFFITEPTKFDNVIVPFPGYIHGKQFLSDIQRDALSIFDAFPVCKDKKIYISRGKISSLSGSFENEQDIEEKLIENGWKIFNPQENSILEQLKEISSAEIVFGLESSAFHLAILLKNLRNKFIAIARNDIESQAYRLIANVYKLDYSTIFIDKKLTHDNISPPLRKYKLDIKKLENFLYTTNQFHNINLLPRDKIINRSIKSINIDEAKDILDENNDNCVFYEKLFYISHIISNTKCTVAKKLFIRIMENKQITYPMIFEILVFFIKSKDLDIIQNIYACIKRLERLPTGVYTRFASQYLEIGYYDIAKELIKEETKLEPHYGPAFRILSQIYYKQNDLEKAIVYARKAIICDPFNLNFLKHLSILLTWNRDYKNAIALMYKALSINIKFGGAYFQLSHIYNRIDDINTAIYFSKLSIKFEPSNDNYVNHLNNLLRKKFYKIEN